MNTESTAAVENGATVDSEEKKTETAVDETAQTGETKTDESNDEKRLAELDRLVQARVDRLLADERKKSAELKKKYDKLAKEKLSGDELKEQTISEREQAVEEKEKALTLRDHQWHAMKALKAAGLDDGSDTVLELVDFVLAEDEQAITDRVKTFSELVKRMVAAEVEKTFKANGRQPNGAKDAGDGSDADTSVAERIGKNAAESAKQSNDILKHYLGG